MSREERRAALESWKIQYSEQRTALASMQVEMVDLVKANPDIGKEELLAVLEKFQTMKFILQKFRTVKK